MHYRLLQAALGLMMLTAFGGCGLDGMKGRLIRIEDEHYVLRLSGGEEKRILVDERTRKDPVAPGDHVQVFVSKDGHAAYVQRLN
jgi:S1 domain